MRRCIRRLVLLLSALVALSTTGCATHQHRAAQHHHERAPVVTIAEGHTHGQRCGHYRHDGRWYLHAGHVHGKRCGHRLVRGIWVLR